MNKTQSALAFMLLVLIVPLSLFSQVSEAYQASLIDYSEVTIDLTSLKSQLEEAPLKGLAQVNRASATIIDLPLPDGSIQQFRVVESPILSASLSSHRPEFKSYIAQGIDDLTATARFNITPVGFYAVISGINGISYVELTDKKNNNDAYITYYDHDIIEVDNESGNCESDHSEIIGHDNGESNFSRTNSCFQIGDNLRNYDMVLTCSGEFYALNGNSDAAVETALLNRVTQINTVYEKEMSISFTIVEYLLNSNPATDPFTDPTNTVTSLTQGEDYINNNVTVGSWDIGHSFHEITCGGGCGWAGRAGLGVVCTSSKARGYTYLPNDIPSSVTVLLHEVGHMFSCRHSNYGCNSGNSCGRYEPGQGSSIMSTSAGCDAGDFFASRTDYFGIGSLDAINNYMTAGELLTGSGCSSTTVSGWSDCSALTATGNNMPTSDANSSSIDGLKIPHSTPFTLTGSGSDADGAGSLTYNWEQFDTDYSGSDAPDDAGANVDGPLFRSFPPSTSVERTLPQLTSVLAGNVTTGTGEVLPTVGRTLTWRLTVRDNEMGGGGIACDEISLTVGTDGPFEITTQNTTTAWSSGNTETIFWNVANTNDVTYTCPTIDILYSSDGGNTFGITLASNVANDGAQDITVPATATSTGRIKIVCSGGTNIFFDINNVDIAVVSGCPAEGGTISNSEAVSADAGDVSLNLSLCAGTPVTSISGVLDAGDPNSNLAVENNGSNTCIQLGNSPKYETFEFSIGSNVSTTFTRTSQPDYTSMITLYQDSYDPSNECTNWLNSNGDFNGVSTVNLSSAFSQSLVTGTKYVLLPSAFSSTTPTTGNYNVSFNQTLYDASTVTPTGFLYTYVIVDGAGNIVVFDENSDLSNSGTFPADDYTVHGLSYQSGTVLNGYEGGSFATFQTDVNAGTICAALSSNSVSVEITGALPIDLIAFGGKLSENKVLLDWMTLTETDNDYFIIEKSIDGRNFQKIGTVQGSGTTFSSQTYDLIDPKPAIGTNYYRLTQFDFDGTFEIIDRIVSVDYDANQEIAVRPNPVRGNQIQLVYQTLESGPLEVQIFDITGKLLKSVAFETTAARNIFDINLNNLSNGVYVIKTNQLGETQSLRFVKTDF